jgi:hypothetical protein
VVPYLAQLLAVPSEADGARLSEPRPERLREPTVGTGIGITTIGAMESAGTARAVEDPTAYLVGTVIEP